MTDEQIISAQRSAAAKSFMDFVTYSLALLVIIAFAGRYTGYIEKNETNEKLAATVERLEAQLAAIDAKLGIKKTASASGKTDRGMIIRMRVQEK